MMADTLRPIHRFLIALDRLERAAKGEDDHFYGAWYGGSAAEGGHPVAKQDERMTYLHADERLTAAGFYGTDLSGVDEQAIGQIVTSAEAIAAAYPAVMENMKISIEARRNVTDPRSYAATATVTYNGVPGTHGLMKGDARIYLNANKFADHASLVQSLQSDHAAGWIAGGSVHHVIAHEFGHVVDGALGHPSASAALRAASQYAKTDPQEAFAEAFATGDASVGAIVAGLR